MVDEDIWVTVKGLMENDMFKMFVVIIKIFIFIFYII